MLNRIKEYLKNRRFVFKVDDDTRILVIAPHPDDEAIGMGGFLLKYATNCTVVLATNGCNGNPEWSREQTIDTRKTEFINALNSLGVEDYKMLDVDDTSLKKNIDVLGGILTDEYDYIFIPNRKDKHPDHQCIYRYVKNKVNSRGLHGVVIEYEVWTPLQNPNLFIDITDCHKEKEQVVQIYESQIVHCQYDWGSTGLNMYRGMLSSHKYAEAFYVNKSLFDRVFDKLKTFKDRYV